MDLAAAGFGRRKHFMFSLEYEFATRLTGDSLTIESEPVGDVNKTVKFGYFLENHADFGRTNLALGAGTFTRLVESGHFQHVVRTVARQRAG